MGRNQRDKATFAFSTKKISMYRPTQGQAMSFALLVRSAKNDGMAAAIRFFAVLESLVVRKSDWEWMENQLMIGAVDFPDYSKLLNSVLEHEWDDTTPPGEESDAGE